MTLSQVQKLSALRATEPLPLRWARAQKRVGRSRVAFGARRRGMEG